MSTRENQTLTILHTNDIHSHFGSMSTIAAMINEERDQGGNFLVLDIGDHMDRMAVETEGTLGTANVDVINLTGYDAITIGNNEGLTFTPDQLTVLRWTSVSCGMQQCCGARYWTCASVDETFSDCGERSISRWSAGGNGPFYHVLRIARVGCSGPCGVIKSSSGSIT